MHHSMKCCPKDKNIKKDWIEKLESESSNVSDDTVIEKILCCQFVLSVKIQILQDRKSSIEIFR